MAASEHATLHYDISMTSLGGQQVLTSTQPLLTLMLTTRRLMGPTS